jgi:hypothetical protein
MDRCSVAATLFRNTIDNGALFGMGTWCKDYGCPGIAVPCQALRTRVCGTRVRGP